MSAPYVIHWPASDVNQDVIAPFQLIGDDLTLKINSNLPNMPNVSVNNSGSYELHKMIRQIYFNSEDDISAFVFVATGLSCPVDDVGNPSGPLEVFEETIPSDGAINHISSNRLYKRVDSLRSNRVSTDEVIGVGFGDDGITDYIFLNTNSPAPQHWAIQVQPILNGGDPDQAFYEVYCSLNKPEVINYNYGNVFPYPVPLPYFSALTNNGNPGLYTNLSTTITAEAPIPAGFATTLWVNISSLLSPNPTEFYITFVQQGIAG